MIRPVLTELALFVTPFALYALYLLATRAGLLDPQSWPLARIAWLAIAALVLMIGSFLYFSHFTGAPVGATYVPGAHGEWCVRAGGLALMQPAAAGAEIVAALGLHTQPLSRLMSALDRDGEEARIVGGAVRNALLGEPVSEIDIATTAVPEEVMRRVANEGLKAVPTGISHGTVTAVADGKSYEVTTLRRDVETFGRRATVAFGRDWTADAQRRDFTMNALSVSRDGALYDPVEGMADLKVRCVRFIGDPEKRIAEDYLRILRFFRFHAAYGTGEIDRDGFAACISGRAGLRQLSRERVRSEMLKLLTAKGAIATLSAMTDAGLLVQVLGGVPNIVNAAAMAAIESAFPLAPDPLRRLAALAVMVGEDADRLRDKLRLTNSERQRLASMADGWWRVSRDFDEHAARALLYELGAASFADRVLTAWARSGSAASDRGWQALLDLPQRWNAPAFPLKAGDFMARGVAQGPALGATLAAAERAWIAADFPDDAARLAALADQAIAK